LSAFPDLIPDAPQDYAGMIAVAQDHALEIPLPPLPEIEVVVFGILGLLPAVECFIDHQHTQTVAGIQKTARGRIMTRTDSVIAVRLEDLQASLFGSRDAD